MMWLSENERIHQRITDMYADFVRDVDPRGYVIDYLLQQGVVNDETAQQLRKNKTSQRRCRAMLDELRSSGNPKAYIELRTALEREYDFVVQSINKGTIHYKLQSIDKEFSLYCLLYSVGSRSC